MREGDKGEECEEGKRKKEKRKKSKRRRSIYAPSISYFVVVTIFHFYHIAKNLAGTLHYIEFVIRPHGLLPLGLHS